MKSLIAILCFALISSSAFASSKTITVTDYSFTYELKKLVQNLVRELKVEATALCPDNSFVKISKPVIKVDNGGSSTGSSVEGSLNINDDSDILFDSPAKEH